MYFYHVSYNDLGDKWLFYPRIPASRSYDEDDSISRICVSTDLIKCLYGITGCGEGLIFKEFDKFDIDHDIFVYELYSLYFMQPSLEQCYDVYRTDEHWILNDCIGYKIGIIDMYGLQKEHRINFIRTMENDVTF